MTGRDVVVAFASVVAIGTVLGAVLGTVAGTLLRVFSS